MKDRIYVKCKYGVLIVTLEAVWIEKKKEGKEQQIYIKGLTKLFINRQEGKIL